MDYRTEEFCFYFRQVWRFVIPRKYQDRLCSPRSFLSNRYAGASSLGDGRPGRKADRPLVPPCADVKNEWQYYSASPQAFLASTGIFSVLLHGSTSFLKRKDRNFGQEFPWLLCNPKIHCRFQQYKPFDSKYRKSSIHCTTSYNISECFPFKKIIFSAWTNRQHEGPTAVGLRNCLYNILAAAFCTWRTTVRFRITRRDMPRRQEIRLKCITRKSQ